MKFFVPILLLVSILSACAPRGIVLGRPSSDKPQRSGSERPYVVSGSTDSLPPRSGGNIGLLEPKELTNLPDERDMRPTGGNRDSGPVIANPPSGDSANE